jgi:hypothetical protein
VVPYPFSWVFREIAVASLDDLLPPADAPGAAPVPAAVPCPVDDMGDAPRGPGEEGAGAVPAVPGELALDLAPSGLLSLHSGDASFASGVGAAVGAPAVGAGEFVTQDDLDGLLFAPVVAPAASAGEGGGGSASLLAAAGLALGLGG